MYHLTYHSAIGVVTRYGYLGVNLFFIISGFVILWSAQGRAPRAFVISRFARLYPAYWLCMGITLCAIYLSGSPVPPPKTVMANITMLAGYFGVPYIDGVYWTLQVELKFYFIVLTLLILRQMHRVDLWILVWLSAAASTVVIRLPSAVTSLLLLPHAPLFIAGCLLFRMRVAGFTLSRTVQLIVCGWMACLSALEQGPNFMFGQFSVVPPIVVAICFLLVAAVAARRVRVPEKAAWAALGALTYPLYLLHNRVGKLVQANESTLAAIVFILLLAFVADQIDRPIARRVRTNLSKLLNASV
jgi:peptidoglycan/LPS O-acetylase OafA/YrhL